MYSHHQNWLYNQLIYDFNVNSAITLGCYTMAISDEYHVDEGKTEIWP